MRSVTLDTHIELSQAAIAQALALTAPEETWADLIVHPSKLLPALQLKDKHNRNTPKCQLRLLTSAQMGHEDWNLRTKTVEVKSEWKM